MRYVCDMESIRQHKVPEWYENDKYGIFIHWGPYSVPAYAPPTWALGDVPTDENWFTNNPYAEWYCNSIRVRKGPTWEHHKATYGEDFPYENFVDMWKAENWNPDEWAQLFREAGAKYVVPTTKHHDGFCLWDSKYTDFNTARRGPRRDIVAELSAAVRKEGIRFGVYYSGIIDWSFVHEPMLSDYDVHHPYNISYAYSDYAYNQMTELIDKYKPSVLWNDIDWPLKGVADLPYLFAHYYNTVEDGVVNDRWNNVWYDFTTKEYNQGEKTLDHKWECCRGLGLSFGYNQVEDDRHIIAPNDFVELLIDTVAHGGNLLINIGPKADGSIPENQKQRLLYLGAWLKVNGEAIYGTRMFDRHLEEAATGEKIYYTAKDDAVYALIVGPKAGDSTVILPGFGGKTAAVLGETDASVTTEGGDLAVRLTGVAEGSPAIVVRIEK